MKLDNCIYNMIEKVLAIPKWPCIRLLLLLSPIIYLNILPVITYVGQKVIFLLC